MKKIRLNVADLGATEILTREQLESVFGGTNSCKTSIGTSWTCGITEINNLLFCACFEN